jgi:hypothetical protein
MYGHYTMTLYKPKVLYDNGWTSPKLKGKYEKHIIASGLQDRIYRITKEEIRYFCVSEMN